MKTIQEIYYCNIRNPRARDLTLNIKKWKLNQSNLESDFIIIKRAHLISEHINKSKTSIFVQYQKSKDPRAETLAWGIRYWSQKKFNFKSDLIVIERQDSFPVVEQEIDKFDEETDQEMMEQERVYAICAKNI